MLHAILTCKNHPDLRWSCQSIAVNDDGSYNGCRNIIPTPWAQECSCPPSELTFAPECAPLAVLRAEE